MRILIDHGQLCGRCSNQILVGDFVVYEVGYDYEMKPIHLKCAVGVD